MALLKSSLPHYPITKFQWHNHKLSTEASMLRPVANMASMFGQVYDDAIDCGLVVIGNREQVIFVLEDEVTRDGDTVYWKLKSLDHRKDTPQIEMIIFNT